MSEERKTVSEMRAELLELGAPVLDEEAGDDEDLREALETEMLANLEDALANMVLSGEIDPDPV